jgi:hypothetical protein
VCVADCSLEDVAKVYKMVVPGRSEVMHGDIEKCAMIYENTVSFKPVHVMDC